MGLKCHTKFARTFGRQRARRFLAPLGSAFKVGGEMLGQPARSSEHSLTRVPRSDKVRGPASTPIGAGPLITPNGKGTWNDCTDYILPCYRGNRPPDRYSGMERTMIGDPTIEEMRSLLATIPGADAFDREGAIYWFAADYHGGQGSNLYSALSRSQYRPGAWERRPHGVIGRECYDALIERYCRFESGIIACTY